QIALNPYVYLPFTGYAMAFLSPFSLPQASLVWFIINHLLVAGCVYHLSALFPKRRPFAAAVLTLTFALSVPLLRTLSAGQLSLPQLYFIIFTYGLLSKNKQRWAGICLALITLYKLMPGIYLFYLLLRKKYEALLSMII